jgi:hypothetical protein
MSKPEPVLTPYDNVTFGITYGLLTPEMEALIHTDPQYFTDEALDKDKYLDSEVKAEIIRIRDNVPATVVAKKVNRVLDTTMQQISKQDERVAKLDEEIRKKSNTVTELDDEIDDKTKRKQSLDQVIKLLQDEYNTHEQNSKIRLQNIQSLNEKHTEGSRTLEIANTELKEIETQLTAKQAELHAVSEFIAHQEMDKKKVLEEILDSRIKLNDMKTLESKRLQLVNEIEEKEKTKADMLADIAETRKKLQEYLKRMQAANEEARIAEEQFEQLQHDIEELQEEIHHLQAVREHEEPLTNAILAEIQQKYDELQEAFMASKNALDAEIQELEKKRDSNPTPEMYYTYEFTQAERVFVHTFTGQEYTCVTVPLQIPYGTLVDHTTEDSVNTTYYGADVPKRIDMTTDNIASNLIRQFFINNINNKAYNERLDNAKSVLQSTEYSTSTITYPDVHIQPGPVTFIIKYYNGFLNDTFRETYYKLPIQLTLTSKPSKFTECHEIVRKAFKGLPAICVGTVFPNYIYVDIGSELITNPASHLKITYDEHFDYWVWYFDIRRALTRMVIDYSLLTQ